ncbi:MAG TPA: ribosome recycling factor [Clostridiaceae bacterium]|jgi:ribosome recycling factor|nr:ribosome recycling factor [Clostridiaceae bacterium]HBG37927.1 ribosome recycling factor [Clostridiaceae bacterium]HBN29526.1 ribosome recycling factor [Clostridiaceae bacterium]HBX48637.1 ribosome recycling factor [Clostridiaceae bacterium]HCL49397.1 ribosome recycling factor [Clostridiaceae bacterium]
MSADIKKLSEEKMKKSIDVLKKELQGLKAGRANPAMLDKISVDYYGTMTPIGKMASITTPEPRLFVIQPWDKGVLKNIEKAILKSDLGLTPTNDGQVIRMSVPELTEETRKNLVKVIKKNGEEAKVAIRAIRREANDKTKAMKKEENVSEDEVKKVEEEVQKLTDNYIKEIDKIVETKEKEIMSV